MSAETRKLMEQVLASKANEDEMSSRVATLLAGTSLTTTKGFKGEGRQVDAVEYNGGNKKRPLKPLKTPDLYICLWLLNALCSTNKK